MSLKAKQIVVQEEEQHVHSWKTSYNRTEQYCACGWIRVSEAEYERRIAEWNSYFEYVATTDSYRDYMSMRGAGSTETRQEIVKRAEKRLEADDYAAKPGFPDPTTWHKYITV